MNKKQILLEARKVLDIELKSIKSITSCLNQNFYCTKIASKLARTFTDKHGYKDICKDLLNKNIIKVEQTSDWGVNKLSVSQQKYAATDVLHLHNLQSKLNEILNRENRVKLAEGCFKFVEHRVMLDLSGWSDIDIFKH